MPVCRCFLLQRLPCHIPVLSHIFFFFNDTATTEIYTLSLHDALPISRWTGKDDRASRQRLRLQPRPGRHARSRSEEHTSELQSQSNLVCRLLLEKKKKKLPRRRSSRRLTPRPLRPRVLRPPPPASTRV